MEREEWVKEKKEIERISERSRNGSRREEKGKEKKERGRKGNREMNKKWKQQEKEKGKRMKGWTKRLKIKNIGKGNGFRGERK